MSIKYESRYAIGEKVLLKLAENIHIFGYIRTVIFTSSKVRYSIWSKETETTLHNIDSSFVSDVDPSDREILDMPEDNYS